MSYNSHLILAFIMKKLTSRERLIPRKKPAQARSNATVDAILEAAAHILESGGFNGYTTNKIAARAGVSIGSLYQYFPSKNSVTLALIERERSELLHEIRDAGTIKDWRAGLKQMIRVAINYQLRRPALAKLLDFEEGRLSEETSTSNAVTVLHESIMELLQKRAKPPSEGPLVAAADIIAITRALTDAAGERGESKTIELENRIERTILGYLRDPDV